MKKRLVITLVLVGLLAFGAGMGTYAWFSASVTSTNNQFNTGTFEINNNYGNVTHTLFQNQSDVKPGDVAIDFTDMSIQNTGTLDMDVRALVDVTAVYSDDSPNTGTPETEEFLVNPAVTLNGTAIEPVADDGVDANGWMSVNDFENWLETITRTLNGSADGNGDTLVIDGQIKLDSDAENEYQGVNLTIGVTVYAKQTNAQWHEVYSQVFAAPAE